MENTFRKTLSARIEALESELRSVRAALSAYDAETETPLVPASPENRFAGVRPLYGAIEQVLRDNGGRMSREGLMEALVAGGATQGKKRGVHNLRISIDTNATLGKLKLEGDDVLLSPEEL
jgi:hypothetical protein